MAVYCSVMQCVAVCCSSLQCAAMNDYRRVHECDTHDSYIDIVCGMNNALMWGEKALFLGQK